MGVVVRYSDGTRTAAPKTTGAAAEALVAVQKDVLDSSWPIISAAVNNPTCRQDEGFMATVFAF